MMDDPVKSTLTRKDVEVILSLVKHDLNKQIRRKEKSTFVPEPGRRDLAAYKITKMQELLDKLEQLKEVVND